MGQSLFMVIRRYGGPYDPRVSLEEQADWEAHRAFMNMLETKGLARLAGPLEGGEDVLLIFSAESREALEQQLASDPWTRSGILSTIRIERWNLRLGQVS